MRIGTGRYSSILARLLQGAATLEVAPELSPEVSPIIVLESQRPEWDYLGNQRIFTASSFVTAGAALPGTLRLFVPTAQTILAVIEAIAVTPTTAANVQVNIGANVTPLANVVASVTRDSRVRTTVGGLVSSGLSITQETSQSPSGTIAERFAAPAGVGPSRFQCLPVILGPGGSLDISLDTVTLAMFVHVLWREREIGRYER
jgi:hypothetical protein